MRDIAVLLAAAGVVIAAGLYINRRNGGTVAGVPVAALPQRFQDVIRKSTFASGSPDRIINPWPDTEAPYQGTWTSRGPLDLATYNGQIYD